MKYVRNYDLIFPILLGIMVFYVVCGGRILDPQNIAWLANGDPAQHYLGWVFFRNSEWTFPIIGLNPNFGLEISSSIVFSDSNPLCAIIFKLLSPILPTTFQYFGIWLLLCFILQAITSYKLVSLISNNKVVINLAVLLFLFSPPFLLRLHGHFNLVSHFTILFALYFVFSKNFKNYYWTVLLLISILTHFYLFVIVFILYSYDIFTKSLNLPKLAFIKNIFITFILLVITMYQVGYFANNVNASAEGFGLYKMNLLSIIDSGTVEHSTQWSYIIKDIAVPSIFDYEGFNYLGLGVLFLLITSTITIINNYQNIIIQIKQQKYLIFLCILLFIYALSNNIAIGIYEFHYYLPNSILKFTNILRASGRFFWIIFYLLIFSLLSILVKYNNQKTTLILLFLAVIIQIVDTNMAWRQIRNKMMITSEKHWSIILKDKFWNKVPKYYTRLRHIPLGNNIKNWIDLSYYSANNNLKTDAVYLARAQGKNFFKAVEKMKQVIQNGNFETDAIYIFDDENYSKVLEFKEQHKEITKYHLYIKVDGFNVVAPNWFKYNK